MLLLHVLLVVLALAYPLEHIAIVRVFHHDTIETVLLIEVSRYLPERRGRLVEESLLVAGNKGILDTGKDADLVESILLFAVGQVLNFDFLKSVLLSVFEALHFVNTRV